MLNAADSRCFSVSRTTFPATACMKSIACLAVNPSMAYFAIRDTLANMAEQTLAVVCAA